MRRCSSGIRLVVVRRRGSVRTGPVTTAFFSELPDVLERPSASSGPLLLVGDINIRLEWTSESDVVEFNELFAGCGWSREFAG
jgi:endonuclease/exonuclease/phosphatase (EEP) superfamily protein YafD